VTRLDVPVQPEPPRAGEDGLGCASCHAGLDGANWADGRWGLRTAGDVSISAGLLCPREHLDLADLDERHAAELGVLTVRLERALSCRGGVGRVHVMQVGDGSAHQQVWFLARPEGLLQLRGSSLSDWTDCLPPMTADQWTAVRRELAALMSATGGEALV